MRRLPQIALLSDGRRLHLQDGPIDLIVEARGRADEVHAAYEAADKNVRRLFNQAFFEKLYLQVDGEVTHDLAEPFNLLLDPDLPERIAESRSARGRKKSGTASGAKTRPRNGIDLERIEAEGSNVDTVVPPEGFEPSTSRSGGARSNPLSYEGNRAVV